MFRMQWFIVAALIVCSAAVGQTRTPLAWKWEAGRELRYRVVEEMKQDSKGPEEATFKAETTREFVYTDAVEKVSEKGEATVRRTFEELRIDAKHSIEGNVKYDSTKPLTGRNADAARHTLVKPYAAMVGKSFTFTVDAEGKVTDVDGLAAIIGDAEREIVGDSILGQLMGGVTDESCIPMVENSLRVVPGRQVTKGETWNALVDQPIPFLGSMSTDLTFTFKSLGRDDGHPAAKIDVKGSFSLRGRSGLGQLIDLQMREGDVKGDVLFDPTAGVLRKSEMNTRYDFEIKGLAGMELDEPIRQKMTQTATLELISGA